jgi:hypothetical protein
MWTNWKVITLRMYVFMLIFFRQLLNQIDSGPLPASASEIAAVPSIKINADHTGM